MAQMNQIDLTRDIPKAHATILGDRIQNCDVLLGRGKHVHYHTGNVAYREVIKAKAREYQSKPCLEKDTLARSIIRLVHSRGGRFLCREGSHWVECSNSIMLSKVKQALRDTTKNEKAASGAPRKNVAAEAATAPIKRRTAQGKQDVLRKEAEQALRSMAKRDNFRNQRSTSGTPLQKEVETAPTAPSGSETVRRKKDVCPNDGPNEIANLDEGKSDQQEYIDSDSQLEEDPFGTVQPLPMEYSREIGLHVVSDNGCSSAGSMSAFERDVIGLGIESTPQLPSANLPAPSAVQRPWPYHLFPYIPTPAFHPTELLREPYGVYPRLAIDSRTAEADQALRRMSQCLLEGVQHHEVFRMN